MSQIASAQIILHLLLVTAEISEWREDPGNPALLMRDARLTVRVLESFKKATDVTQVAFVAQQRRAVSSRIPDFLGVWSHVELKVGAEYLVFVDAPAQTLAESLGDRASLVLDTADPNWAATLSDLRLAQQADFDARKLLNATAGTATGPLGAEFLYDQLGPDPELLRRVEASDQPVRTRERLLMRFATEDVDRLEAAGLHAPLARVMMRLVAQNAPARLTTRVRQAYLENVLLGGSESPRLKPAELLPDANERKRIAGALADDPSPAAKDAARWLGGAPWRKAPRPNSPPPDHPES